MYQSAIFKVQPMEKADKAMWDGGKSTKAVVTGTEFKSWLDCLQSVGTGMNHFPEFQFPHLISSSSNEGFVSLL